MTQNLKPIINNLKQKWEKREELRQQVVATVKLTRDVLEHKAREVAVQAKDHRLVTDYVRPAVSSQKTEEVLGKIQTRFNNPVVSKLGDLRKQFLDFTEPVTKEAVTVSTTEDVVPDVGATDTVTESETDETAPKKRKSKKVAKDS